MKQKKTPLLRCLQTVDKAAFRISLDAAFHIVFNDYISVVRPFFRQTLV